MDIEISNKNGMHRTVLLANMDEIPCYFDMRRRTTSNWKGSRTVAVVRNRGEQKRISVCLTILSDGTKLPP